MPKNTDSINKKKLFIDLAKELWSSLYEERLSSGPEGLTFSRRYTQFAISMYLRRNEQLRTDITDAIKNEDIIKDFLSSNRQPSILDGLLSSENFITRNSKNNKSIFLVDNFGTVSSYTPEDIVEGIILASIDKAVMVEGKITKNNVLTNIPSIYAEFRKYLQGEEIQTDYLLSYTGFKSSKKISIGFDELVGISFNDCQSNYFFDDNNIGLVVKKKVNRKMLSSGSLDDVNKYIKKNGIERERQKFIDDTEKCARNIQLALILTLTEKDEPFFATIRKGFLLNIDGSIQEFINNYGANKTSSRQLTKDYEKRVSIKYLTIEDNDLSKISVAIKRLLSAVCYRGDPSDSLIDATICWENIVGSKDETTFKVCASAAKLLEKRFNNARRRDLFDELTAIYDRRCKIVHGSTDDNPNIEDVNLAIYYAANLVDSIISSRDLLLMDNNERSKAILLSL